MNVGPKGNGVEWQSITKIRRYISARADCRSHTQSVRRENVTQLAIGIFNKSNTRGAVWIIFDSEHFRRDALLAPFKIDFAVFLLVTAADMPRRETAKMITATG